MMLKHRIKHIKGSLPEFQLVSEEAPDLLLGEIQRRYFLAYEQGMRYLIFYIYTSVVEREHYF